jgi:hypothetical protein
MDITVIKKPNGRKFNKIWMAITQVIDDIFASGSINATPIV